jgi:uncharacterized RDD family membrane protein YckC
MAIAGLDAPGFWRRVGAFGLDYILISGYLIVLGGVCSFLVFGPLKEHWQGLAAGPVLSDLIAFVMAVLPVMLYFTLLESSVAAATWGKRRMGIKVVRVDGAPLTRARALLRSAIKFAPWQLAHTCLFHIPGWPFATETPPTWVDDRVWRCVDVGRGVRGNARVRAGRTHAV